MVLGIESSFDDSAACLVSVRGQMVSPNVKYTKVPDLSQEYSGGVDPKFATLFHEKHVPLAIENALSHIGDNKLHAISVTVGPG